MFRRWWNSRFWFQSRYLQLNFIIKEQVAFSDDLFKMVRDTLLKCEPIIQRFISFRMKGAVVVPVPVSVGEVISKNLISLVCWILKMTQLKVWGRRSFKLK